MVASYLLLTPLIILLVHTVLARAMIDPSRQIGAVYSCLFGAVPMGIILHFEVFLPNYLTHQPVFWDVVYSLIVYFSIAYSYFHFFNISETSVRVRLLRELHSDGWLTHRDIFTRYNDSKVIDRRLIRLMETGQLEYRYDYYVVKSRLLVWGG